MSRTAKTASTVPTNADVNDMSLLDDDALLTSETVMPEVDLMSEDSLACLLGKLGIDFMSSKIGYLSEIVEQALTADSVQPCKRKHAQLMLPPTQMIFYRKSNFPLLCLMSVKPRDQEFSMP